MRQLLIMVSAVGVLGAAAAAAHTRDEAANKLNCPSAAREQKAQLIEDKMAALEDRLEALDSRMEAIETDRRAALDDAKSRIEQAARNDSFSPAQLDAEVASALSTADARAKTAAASTNQARTEIATVRAEMLMLKQELRGLASGKPSESDRTS